MIRKLLKTRARSACQIICWATLNQTMLQCARPRAIERHIQNWELFVGDIRLSRSSKYVALNGEARWKHDLNGRRRHNHHHHHRLAYFDTFVNIMWSYLIRSAMFRLTPLHHPIDNISSGARNRKTCHNNVNIGIVFVCTTVEPSPHHHLSSSF